MAVPKIDNRNFRWENIRAKMARGIAFTRARAAAYGLAGTTLESSIAEAIMDIDSAQTDPIASLGAGDAYVDDTLTGVNTGVNKGRLQKVDDLITLYYGDGENPGLFDQFRELADPNVGSIV